MRVRVLASFALVALSSTFTVGARADAPATAPGERAEPAPPALSLEVSVAGAGLDPDAVRAEVAGELGVELASPSSPSRGAAVVRIATRGRRATVTFEVAGGAPVVRVVDLPTHAPTATGILALLVANLVRDEASALVDGLRARAKAREDAARARAEEDAARAVAEAEALRRAEAEPAAPASPGPSAFAPPPPSRRGSEPGPCDTPLGPIPVGVDLLPGLGTSTLADGRASTRAFSLGVVGDLGSATRGADVAGALAMATRATCGAQVAGAVALTLGPVVGAQLAGGASVAARLRGVQLAPLTLTTGDVTGAQLGVVNVALGDVTGAQVGIVNVARRADAQVGVLSLQAEGGTFVEVAVSDAAVGTVAVVHGGRVLHGIYGLGGRAGGAGGRVALVLGIGARLVDGRIVSLDLDAIATGLARPSALGTWSTLAQTRAVVGVRLGAGLSVFAGPTYDVLVTDDVTERAQTPLPLLFDRGGGDVTSVRGWVGGVLGVRLGDAPAR